MTGEEVIYAAEKRGAGVARSKISRQILAEEIDKALAIARAEKKAK